MEFELKRTIEILESTPKTLKAQLEHLSDDWVQQNEGEGTWSVFDVVGHLVHGETTDWIARTKIILSASGDKTFEPFDRFAQERDSVGKSLNDLLGEFETLRNRNIETLKGLVKEQTDFNQKGIHPALGEVTLAQLLSTWTVHDLGHIAQINRIMAKQYQAEVGPWKEYLRIIN